ncbi:MAG: 30S ribosomal protein S5 [candidate division WWE3 bacterium]|nr:30S ribosomal protein S5 [candidate division WWE3 bacterium]
MAYQPREKSEYEEKIIQNNRTSKKIKGGNKVGYAVLVCIGNRKGQVGVALGKAPEVATALHKAVSKAKRALFTIPLRNNTIPGVVATKFGGASVLLKPAPAGSGLIAGGALRIILDLGGVHDVSAKMLGNNNKINNAYATVKALKLLSATIAKRT